MYQIETFLNCTLLNLMFVVNNIQPVTKLRLDIIVSTIKIFLKKIRNKKIDSQKALRKRIFHENFC